MSRTTHHGLPIVADHNANDHLSAYVRNQCSTCSKRWSRYGKVRDGQQFGKRRGMRKAKRLERQAWRHTFRNLLRKGWDEALGRPRLS